MEKHSRASRSLGRLVWGGLWRFLYVVGLVHAVLWFSPWQPQRSLVIQPQTTAPIVIPTPEEEGVKPSPRPRPVVELPVRIAEEDDSSTTDDSLEISGERREWTVQDLPCPSETWDGRVVEDLYFEGISFVCAGKWWKVTDTSAFE